MRELNSFLRLSYGGERERESDPKRVQTIRFCRLLASKAAAVVSGWSRTPKNLGTSNIRATELSSEKVGICNDSTNNNNQDLFITRDRRRQSLRQPAIFLR